MRLIAAFPQISVLARFTRATFHNHADGPLKAGHDGAEDDSVDKNDALSMQPGLHKSLEQRFANFDTILLIPIEQNYDQLNQSNPLAQFLNIDIDHECREQDQTSDQDFLETIHLDVIKAVIDDT